MPFEVWSLVSQVPVRLLDNPLHRLAGAEVFQALVVQRQQRAVRVLDLVVVVTVVVVAE